MYGAAKRSLCPHPPPPGMVTCGLTCVCSVGDAVSTTRCGTHMVNADLCAARHEAAKQQNQKRHFFFSDIATDAEKH